MSISWGRLGRPLCPLGPLWENRLVVVVVEDDEEEEEESLGVALQAHLCWSMELAKIGLSCCWAHSSVEAATAAAADEAAAAAAAAAAACCCASDAWLEQVAWF